MLYKIYAVPLGVIVAFFITRSQLRRHAFVTAAGITLAWTLVLFTPLVSRSQTFFSDMYAPWYMALSLTPPTPHFSAGALLITVAVSLISSVLALMVAKR